MCEASVQEETYMVSMAIVLLLAAVGTSLFFGRLAETLENRFRERFQSDSGKG